MIHPPRRVRIYRGMQANALRQPAPGPTLATNPGRGGSETRPRGISARIASHHLRPPLQGGSTMTTHPHPLHRLKSPTGYPLCGWRGLRGPTYRQLRSFAHTPIAKIPHCCADFALPYPAPSEEEEEELVFASSIRLSGGSRVVEPPFPLKVLDFPDCNPPMRLFCRQASCFLRSSSSLRFTSRPLFSGCSLKHLRMVVEPPLNHPSPRRLS